MERYKAINEVGDGTFGTVWRAINKQSSEVVAIKKMKRKYHSWEECINLREVKSLRRLNHPNIVRLKEVIREHDELFFVFEYMDCNLYQHMKEKGKAFSESEIRNWCFQVFQALAYMHKCGYFHRDMKPENLLVSKDVIKIADFGLAREISSKPPFTDYVSTRWYRAPEVLLQSAVYGPAVDMWAMGAIMYELLTHRPLFPGSSETDQIHKICGVLGSPDDNTWAEGLLFADAINFQFPQCNSIPLSSLLPSASQEAINLISSLCSWDPSTRPTAAKALQHSFFQPLYYIPPSLRPRASLSVPTTPPSVVKGAYEEKTPRRYPVAVPSNRKASNNPCSNMNLNLSWKAPVQRKLEMEHRENERYLKNDVKPSVYQPPVKLKSGYNVGDSMKASDLAEKLANLNMRSDITSNVTQKVHPSNMKSVPVPLQPSSVQKVGGWQNYKDFCSQPYQIPPARSYYQRKLAG